MVSIIRWIATGAAIIAFNLAALSDASALSVPPVHLKSSAAAGPDVVLARDGGGNVKMWRYGGGKSYSPGRSRGGLYTSGSGRQKIYSGDRGRNVADYGRRIRNGGYNTNQGQLNRQRVRNFDGGKRYLGDGRGYIKNVRYDRRHHGDRFRYKHGKYRHYRDGYWYAWPWWLGIGVGIGSFYGGYWGVPVYDTYDAHVEWCLRRYRSYNPATDAYLGYDGYYHRCISPYS